MSPALTVSPLEFRFSLDASTTSTHILTLENPTSSPASFTLRLEPLSSIDSSFTQLSRWVSFPNGTVYSLEPENSLEVSFTVTTPDSLPDGGQYAELLIEFSPDTSEPSATEGLSVISSISIPLYGVVSGGETVRRSELRSLSLSPFLSTSELVASSTLVNSGNIDFSVSNTFSVSSLFGSKLYETSSFVNVLPGSEKSIFFEWQDTPPFGLYRLDYSIEAAGLNTSLSRVVLVASPLYIAIFCFLFTLAVVLRLLLHRSSKTR